MQDSDYTDYMDYMRKMNMPAQYSPMVEMPQEQLESMYPRCYYLINPEVERQCDMFCSKFGNMCTPSRQQLESMVDEVDNNVGAEVDQDYQDFENEERQFYGGFGGGRRRFRRDLISILLLRALRRRRRPHYGGYPPWGYGGGYGVYPY